MSYPRTFVFLAALTALLAGACSDHDDGDDDRGTALLLALGDTGDGKGAAPATTAGLHACSLVWEGRERTWLAYVPEAAAVRPEDSRPLLLVLHGGSGTAAGMRDLTERGFEALAELHDFVVVYPEGVDRHWNDDRSGMPETADLEDVDDVGFIAAVIARCEKRWSTDPSRVFVTGISNGGMMSYRLARQLNDRVAGIAPVVGLMPVLDPPYGYAEPVPCLVIAGTEDPLVPYGGGSITLPPILGGGTRGTVLGAEATTDRLAALNGLPGDVDSSWLPDLVPDDATVTERLRYRDGAPGTAVELYRVVGGGHTWPQGTAYLGEWLIGRVAEDWNACATIWAFFATEGREAAAPEANG